MNLPNSDFEIIKKSKDGKDVIKWLSNDLIPSMVKTGKYIPDKKGKIMIKKYFDIIKREKAKIKIQSKSKTKSKYTT